MSWYGGTGKLKSLLWRLILSWPWQPVLIEIMYITQTWFYEDNKKAEIGNQKYWIYYQKRIRNGKIRNKKVEFRFKADENQVWLQFKSLIFYPPMAMVLQMEVDSTRHNLKLHRTNIIFQMFNIIFSSQAKVRKLLYIVYDSANITVFGPIWDI